MKKEEGFTLIELLAVIVILGVIMIIAIPSVTNYITNSRKDSYVSDAKMFLDAAKTKLTADASLPQGAGEKITIPISDIALDKGGEKSPFGNDWNYAHSYVEVTNIGTSSDPEYTWKVALEDKKGNCIPLTNDKDLKREVVGTGCGITVTLMSLISNNASIDSSINFKDAPTDTTSSGKFIRSGTENNTNPIYYYRGVVSNNNVKFANFCWKIVRTIETGGIKLIYNGVPTDDGNCNNTGSASQIETSKFNENADDNTYVGYMYGTAGSNTYAETHANINDSTIKTVIDAWYQTNMTLYTSKLEDTVWCNDRSLSAIGDPGTGIGNSTTYYGAEGRVASGIANPEIKPSLSCINNNDMFSVSSSIGNGKLTYPVGLLTADEATLAGSGYIGYSTLSYLYTGQNWWLGSAHTFTFELAREAFIGASGDLAGGLAIGAYGVRPSVSLKPGTLVIDGDGSITAPYVVE